MVLTPRPSSPTSLLWAHQLKREHGHLLDRIQKIESASSQQADRLKKAETAAQQNATKDIAALADQVRVLEESGINQRLAKVEKEVMSKLDEVQADSEAMLLKVAALEKDEAVIEEERRKALTKEKALLKRVGEVEESLRKYEASLDRMGKRVDEKSMNVIKSQLENLTRQVQTEGEEMKRLEESLAVLETANGELKKANERMENEIKQLEERSVQVSAPAPAPARAKHMAYKTLPSNRTASLKKAVSRMPAAKPDLEDEDEDDPITPAPKKKSHKWAGGGADKDIIRQGSDLVKRTKPAPPPKRVATPRPVGRPKAAPKVKAQPAPQPRPKLVPKSQAKHVAKAAPAKKARRDDSDLGGAIIRAGKGWVEVAYSPTPAELESEASAPVKRPRGRPRKQPTNESLDDLGLDTQRITRHARQELTSSKVVPQKRNAGTALTGALKDEDSPLSSIPTPGGTTGRRGGVITSPAGEPAPKRRRIIDQDEDITVFQQHAAALSR